MLIYLFLGRSFRGPQDPRSRFGVFSLADIAFLDHLYLRFAIMAQAVSPCHLLLRRRVKVIGHLLSSLLSLTSRGSYGRTQTCP